MMSEKGHRQTDLIIMDFHIPRLAAPVIYNLLLSSGGQEYKFLLKNPRVLFAFEQTLEICVFHFKSFLIVIPK